MLPLVGITILFTSQLFSLSVRTHYLVSLSFVGNVFTKRVAVSSHLRKSFAVAAANIHHLVRKLLTKWTVESASLVTTVLIRSLAAEFHSTTVAVSVHRKKKNHPPFQAAAFRVECRCFWKPLRFSVAP